MAKRRTHSTIDKLPADLRDTITRMLVDNEWPVDHKHIKNGNPRYEDVVDYCRQHGHSISASAVGRFGMRMRTISRMKQAGVITRQIMSDLNDEKASQTQKAVAEMITAVTIEFVSENENFTAKQIKEVAQAMKDCTQIAINSDKYVREQISKKVKNADKNISALAAKKKIDPDVLKMIREEIYGIRK